MTNFQIQEKDSSVLIEEFTVGISHADIGGRLLKNGHFRRFNSHRRISS